MTVRKVHAYITRGDALLVFHEPHFPEAGIQIPGGTMEGGEEPEYAVLREAEEETGLAGLRIVRCLGSYDITFDGADTTETRFVFHLEYTGNTPERWEHWEETPSDGSAPILFELFWMGLDDPALVLAGGQGALLPLLRESHRR